MTDAEMIFRPQGIARGPYNHNNVHSSYLNMILEPNQFRDKLDVAEENLSSIQFDAFAVRGNSGTLFGGALAQRMKKGILMVRKPGDNSHSSMRVEGWSGGKRYIFLDDLIASGKTKREVKEAIEGSEYFRHYEYVGDYTYQDSYFKAFRPTYGPMEKPQEWKVPEVPQFQFKIGEPVGSDVLDSLVKFYNQNKLATISGDKMWMDLGKFDLPAEKISLDTETNL